MRNLTIKREKSFVGCLMKLNVYIVDEYGDTTINNQQCRKLGTLKNGEEVTFLVDDWATRIYVIADKLSKGFCSELYDLPAGTEDVRLTGKCKYSWISGNAFRFNGPVSAEAQVYRKKTSKKGWIVMIVAVILGVAAGLLSSFMQNRTKPKDFHSNELTITLNDGFEVFEQDEGYDDCFISDEVMVMIIRESKADLKNAGLKAESLQEYGELLMDLYEIDGELTVADGLSSFEYDYSDMVEGDYHYMVTVHESADAYWIVEFAVELDNAEEYADQLRAWAKTVRITEKTGQSGAV
jgi:hypothetical protein